MLRNHCKINIVTVIKFWKTFSWFYCCVIKVCLCCVLFKYNFFTWYSLFLSVPEILMLTFYGAPNEKSHLAGPLSNKLFSIYTKQSLLTKTSTHIMSIQDYNVPKNLVPKYWTIIVCLCLLEISVMKNIQICAFTAQLRSEYRTFQNLGFGWWLYMLTAQNVGNVVCWQNNKRICYFQSSPET